MKKRSAGRPVGSGEKLSEGKVLVTGPQELLDQAKDAAEAEGVTVREWWRRAARARLGLEQTDE
jgi:hypothetical protein